MAYSIPLFDLNYDEAEEQAVLAVLRSRWISMGERTAQLEQRFAEHVQTFHAVALGSCTAALHLAMIILDIGPGDEVIVPSLTFAATANCVRYAGATPVFADIVGPEDLTIDPEHVASLISPRTKAVIAMHYAGFSCEMNALLALKARHGFALIEDAAHAPDSLCHGNPLGSIGDIGCFSFFSNKNISCAEGGMLTTSNAEYAARARRLRSHGMTTLSFDRARGHATRYDIAELGYNYRLDDIRAALVLSQMQKLKTDTDRRAEIRREYLQQLQNCASYILPFEANAERCSNYIMPVVLRDGGAQRRDELRQQLAQRGIETSVHYPPVHRFSIYASAAQPLPRTEFAADHEFTIPMHGRLTTTQIDTICNALVDVAKSD